MREYSIPALVEVPGSARLTDVVYRRAEAEPGAVVLRQRTGAGSWQDVTAAQFRAEVTALAKGLIAAGIQPGDRVAVMSRTSYEWTLIDYASWAAGAVTVPVYETSSAEQVEWILGDSAACAVFAETSAHNEIIGGLRGRLPDLEHLWMIAGLDALASGGTQISDEQLEQRRAGRSADLATIVYTSGTTGRPKGCEVTHGNLLADVRNAVGALPEIFEAPGCSTLLFLPLAHVFARIIQVGFLESGAVLGHWPNINTVADGLREFRPSFVVAVPRVFEKVYDGARQQASASAVQARIFAAAADTAIAWSQARDGAGAARGAGPALRVRHAVFDRLVYARLRAALGGKLRYAFSGGAPIDHRLIHFFRGAGITVLEGYGMTESSGAATMNRPGRNKIGTVGQPVPGVTIRIADDGNIQMKGPSMFRGYWRNDAATREALDPDGWLLTGDTGIVDDEGFVQVTGRVKELIITAGGTNVAPAILEDRLRANPLVSQAMVVGEGRPYVAALITLDREGLQFWNKQHGRPAGASSPDPADDPELIAEIQRAVDDANKAVSRAESIRRFRILGTDFTEAAGQLTPTLKVRRDVVAKDFAPDIEALYGRAG